MTAEVVEAGVGRSYGPLAPLYDWLLGQRFFGDLQRTFEWIVRHYGLRFTSAADVACGTGTFVKYLRDIGVPDVFGVDHSPEMLRLAVQKNAGNGACFLLQDLRDVRLPHSVDLVTCHFDSLNYLLSTADLVRALRRFSANLNPCGYAIFDLVTERSTQLELESDVEHAHSPGVLVTRITRRYPAHRLQIARVGICRAGSIMTEIHVQRAYSITEVLAAVTDSGMSIRAVHDFHNPSRPAVRAERAIYLARRTVSS
jgi:SAM-dependent methyltransferase